MEDTQSILEDEQEDEELEAAASHLNKNFYNELADKTQTLYAPTIKPIPIESLLGPLPTAASLGITDSIKECINTKDQEKCKSKNYTVL